MKSAIQNFQVLGRQRRWLSALSTWESLHAPGHLLPCLVRQDFVRLERQLYPLPQDASLIWRSLPLLTKLIPPVGPTALMEHRQRAGSF
jgi:hypothetical protein